MEGSTPSTDEQFAEWYVWAKREVGSDNRVCLGAAQAAVEALDAGGDEGAARVAARRSVAGHAVALVTRIDPHRRAYAEWYDWARREIGGGDRDRLHRATRAALECLQAGGDAAGGAAAARQAVGPPSDAPPPDAPPAASPPAASPPPAPLAPYPVVPPSPSQSIPPGSALGYQPSYHLPYAPMAPPPYARVPPAPTAPKEAYAGFGGRLAAYVVDSILLAVGLFVFLLVVSILLTIGVLSSGQGLTDNGALAIEGVLLVMVTVFAWLYFAGLESSAWQATIGKRLMKVVVTDFYGRRIGFGRASGRYFGKLPVLIGVSIPAAVVAVLLSVVTASATLGVILYWVLFVALALAVMAGILQFTSRRQGLHDLMAGTLVVRQQHLSLITAPPPEVTAPGTAGNAGEVQGA